MRVLAIGCHPDDLEILCYGTLAKHVKNGDDVIVCTIANGSMGDMTIPPRELAQIRYREAANAAKVIGAQEYIGIDVDDLALNPHDDDQIRRLTEAIRYAKPDYIICHGADGYLDYHSDHNYAAEMTFTASFNATIPHYETKSPVHPVIAPLYYMHPTGPRPDFYITDYVDITDTLELKLEAFACHKSQFSWLGEHTGDSSLLDDVRDQARVHGKSCRCQYAEAFQRCTQAYRMTASRLLP